MQTAPPHAVAATYCPDIEAQRALALIAVLFSVSVACAASCRHCRS
jgi:hypothetical protein